MLPTTNLSRTGAVPSTQFAGFALGEEPVELVVRSLDIGESAAQRAAECLSPGERARADRFAFQRDRKRFVAARAGLRGLLASRLGCLPEAVEIVTGIHGKPALSGRHGSDLRFNVSHCGDTVVYAFAHGLDVGVNIEEVRSLPDADEVAAHCFSQRELAEFRSLSLQYRTLGFFNAWTRKEAFVKAIGDGLCFPLNRFDVTLRPGEPAQLLRIDECLAPAHGCQLHAFSLGTGFVGALVALPASESHLCREQHGSRALRDDSASIEFC